MKKVIVTGASQGLGFELSKTFSNHGYNVVGLSRSKPYLDIDHIILDLSDKSSIGEVAHKITSQHQEFSTIIVCAGIGYIEKLDAIDYDHTNEMFQVNIMGQGYLLSLLSEYIKKNNADIVFVGATIAYKGNEYMPMYSVTKRGLRGLAENRRNELKSTGSRVMHISPGGLNTESNVGVQGRETIISKMNGKSITTMLDSKSLSEYIYATVQLPKNMEASEIIINRK